MANSYTAEVIPSEDVKDLFNTNWDETTTGSIPKPFFLVVTMTDQEIRHDLRKQGDLMIIRAGAFKEEPIGNYIYGNRLYDITLEVFTMSSRQRLYDIMQEVKRIVHGNKHSMTNFQRITYTGFEDNTQDTVNVWEGTITLTLENHGVLLET